MRTGIHPEYVEARVHCSCGNTFTTRSTKPELHIELCNKCHPFYTGQQKFVDTGGRVQRFSDKFGGAADTVMARAIAEKKKRQEAHEQAESAAREARATKEAAEAERAAKQAKSKPAEAVVEETPAEAVVEEVPAEAVADTAADEAPVEAAAGETASEEAPVEEPAADEAPSEETPDATE